MCVCVCVHEESHVFTIAGCRLVFHPVVLCMFMSLIYRQKEVIKYVHLSCMYTHTRMQVVGSGYIHLVQIYIYRHTYPYAAHSSCACHAYNRDPITLLLELCEPLRIVRTTKNCANQAVFKDYIIMGIRLS